jgi:hypothetical protein
MVCSTLVPISTTGIGWRVESFVLKLTCCFPFEVTQARLQRILHQMDVQHAQMLEVEQLLREFRAEMHEQWDQLLQSQDAMFQNTQTQLALILERQQQIMQIQPQMQEQMDALKKETQEQIAELRQLCIIQLTRH